MVLILASNSEHVVLAWREKGRFGKEKNPICDCPRSNSMPWTDWITEITYYVRTYFWITVYYKYHDTDPFNFAIVDPDPGRGIEP